MGSMELHLLNNITTRNFIVVGLDYELLIVEIINICYSLNNHGVPHVSIRYPTLETTVLEEIKSQLKITPCNYPPPPLPFK